MRKTILPPTDRHEYSRVAFNGLYPHPNTYDTSQNIRDHIEQTNKIAWEAWCRALDWKEGQEKKGNLSYTVEFVRKLKEMKSELG